MTRLFKHGLALLYKIRISVHFTWDQSITPCHLARIKVQYLCNLWKVLHFSYTANPLELKLLSQILWGLGCTILCHTLTANLYFHLHLLSGLLLLHLLFIRHQLSLHLLSFLLATCPVHLHFLLINHFSWAEQCWPFSTS